MAVELAALVRSRLKAHLPLYINRDLVTITSKCFQVLVMLLSWTTWRPRLGMGWPSGTLALRGVPVLIRIQGQRREHHEKCQCSPTGLAHQCKELLFHLCLQSSPHHRLSTPAGSQPAKCQSQSWRAATGQNRRTVQHFAGLLVKGSFACCGVLSYIPTCAINCAYGLMVTCISLQE